MKKRNKTFNYLPSKRKKYTKEEIENYKRK